MSPEELDLLSDDAFEAFVHKSPPGSIIIYQPFPDNIPPALSEAEIAKRDQEYCDKRLNEDPERMAVRKKIRAMESPPINSQPGTTLFEQTENDTRAPFITSVKELAIKTLHRLPYPRRARSQPQSG